MMQVCPGEVLALFCSRKRATVEEAQLVWSFFVHLSDTTYEGLEKITEKALDQCKGKVERLNLNMVLVETGR